MGYSGQARIGDEVPLRGQGEAGVAFLDAAHFIDFGDHVFVLVLSLLDFFGVGAHAILAEEVDVAFVQGLRFFVFAHQLIKIKEI